MKKDVHFNSLACTTGAKPINYHNLLTRIISGEEVSLNELYKAKQAAFRWQLCSCGTLCELIPRLKGDMANPGRPADSRLESLGLSFYGKMASILDYSETGGPSKEVISKAKEALGFHLAIEKRAQEILDEIVTDEQWIEYINKHSS